ncbi:MAG: RodZ domain-containing protein [Candidatus Acidiferrum sp.]
MARGNFGERLKRERELREVTLQEITSATRIGPRFLEALENEDWEKLPGGVFNRGFVRSIARYLGLDEEALLGEYDLAHGAQVAAEDLLEQKINSSPRWKPAAVVLVVLVLLAALIAAGFFAWRHFSARRSMTQAPPASTPLVTQPPLPVLTPASEVSTPTSTASITAQPAKPAANGPMDLLVSVIAATHLLVLADGSVAFYDEVHAGENRHFTANDSFEVTAADCGAVLLELNSQPLPPLGVAGSSGTIKLSHDDLRRTSSGNAKP